MSDIEAFVKHAEHFCSLLEQPTPDMRVFAQEVTMMLGLLYHGALTLPESFTTQELPEHASDAAILIKLRETLNNTFGEHDATG